jgi:D-galactarolactone cycloisomerase
MKITGVRVHVLRSRLEQPFAFSQGWVNSRGATLVEVSTDEGIVGWGEALCQGLQPPEIAAAAIEHALAPLAMGADPLEPEVLWHRMYHHTRDYGQKGAVIGAISAIDIACWDIAGKARGEPVARLLGGMFRTRVQAYATGFYRLRGRGEAARLVEEAERHVAPGVGALLERRPHLLECQRLEHRPVRAQLGLGQRHAAQQLVADLFAAGGVHVHQLRVFA